MSRSGEPGGRPVRSIMQMSPRRKRARGRGHREGERAMVKRWIAPALGLALVLSVASTQPAMALRLKGMKPAGKSMAKATAATTFKGIIKGAPSGRTYTVVSGKRSVAVDTNHATIRMKGK